MREAIGLLVERPVCGALEKQRKSLESRAAWGMRRHGYQPKPHTGAGFDQNLEFSMQDLSELCRRQLVE